MCQLRRILELLGISSVPMGTLCDHRCSGNCECGLPFQACLHLISPLLSITVSGSHDPCPLQGNEQIMVSRAAADGLGPLSGDSVHMSHLAQNIKDAVYKQAHLKLRSEG